MPTEMPPCSPNGRANRREGNVMQPLASDVRCQLRSRPGANIAVVLAISVSLATVAMGEAANAAATLDHAPYGTTQGGQAVDIYTMTNDHGLRVRFLSYGGVITEIDVPDRRGQFDDI